MALSRIQYFRRAATGISRYERILFCQTLTIDGARRNLASLALSPIRWIQIAMAGIPLFRTAAAGIKRHERMPFYLELTVDGALPPTRGMYRFTNGTA